MCKSRLCVVIAVLAALIACRPAPPLAQEPTTPLGPTARPSSTPAPSATGRPSNTPTNTSTSTPTPTFIPVTPTATLAPLSATQRDEVFQRVWGLVRDHYIYEDYNGLDWEAVRAEFAPQVAAAESSAAFYGLMQQMVERLGDDHSRFESPQDVAEAQARFEGGLSYVGIGATIRTIDEGGLITRLARGGPAEAAGLQIRDIILAINGVPFSDRAAFGPDGPVGAIRGVPGSQVTVTVLSPGQPPRDMTITRKPIPSDAFPAVEFRRLPGGQVGLLTIATFFEDQLDQQVRSQLEAALAEGVLDGLVIDVRANGGGRVDLMLGTLALFIDGGSIGSTSGRSHSTPLNIPAGQVIPQLSGLPIAVLTSDETVSAAEMFAAGMQVRGRARIIGTPSAGNTENLLPYTLSDGSRLWLAELVYQRPDGTPLEGQGVTPDRTVDAEWWRYSTTDDPQVAAALDELRRAREA